MSEDDRPDLVAALDQLKSATKDLAPVIRTHYESLIAAGFTEAEALIFTISFQSVVLTGGPKK